MSPVVSGYKNTKQQRMRPLSCKEGKSGCILNNEYLTVPCSTYIWQSFLPIILFTNPSSKDKNKRSRPDWLFNPSHNPLQGQAKVIKTENFLSTFLKQLHNRYVASFPTDRKVQSNYWDDCTYTLVHINACPYAQTHTDACHILSYSGIRNVSSFFAFLLLEKNH